MALSWAICHVWYPFSKRRFWKWCFWHTSGFWSIRCTLLSCSQCWKVLPSQSFQMPTTQTLKYLFHSFLTYNFLLLFFRFAHLINVDFFADLMSILHSLAETGVSVLAANRRYIPWLCNYLRGCPTKNVCCVWLLHLRYSLDKALLLISIPDNFMCRCTLLYCN